MDFSTTTRQAHTRKPWTHNGNVQFKIVPFSDEVWEMIVGFHCGWEFKETKAGNLIMTVKDSWEELNWLFGVSSKNQGKGKTAWCFLSVNDWV